MKAHVEHDCPLLPVQCPYSCVGCTAGDADASASAGGGGGGGDSSGSDVDEAGYGTASFALNRRSLAAHLKECIQEHLLLSMQTVSAQGRTIVEQGRQIVELSRQLEHSNAAVTSEVADLRSVLSVVQPAVAQLGPAVTQLQGFCRLAAPEEARDCVWAPVGNESSDGDSD